MSFFKEYNAKRNSRRTNGNGNGKRPIDDWDNFSAEFEEYDPKSIVSQYVYIKDTKEAMTKLNAGGEIEWGLRKDKGKLLDNKYLEVAEDEQEKKSLQGQIGPLKQKISKTPEFIVVHPGRDEEANKDKNFFQMAWKHLGEIFSVFFLMPILLASSWLMTKSGLEGSPFIMFDPTVNPWTADFFATSLACLGFTAKFHYDDLKNAHEKKAFLRQLKIFVWTIALIFGFLFLGCTDAAGGMSRRSEPFLTSKLAHNAFLVCGLVLEIALSAYMYIRVVITLDKYSGRYEEENPENIRLEGQLDEVLQAIKVIRNKIRINRGIINKLERDKKSFINYLEGVFRVMRADLNL